MTGAQRADGILNALSDLVLAVRRRQVACGCMCVSMHVCISAGRRRYMYYSKIPSKTRGVCLRGNDKMGPSMCVSICVGNVTLGT